VDGRHRGPDRRTQRGIERLPLADQGLLELPIAREHIMREIFHERMDELAGRLKAFRAAWPEVGRRFASLPRGALGMTLAHLGLGVFVLGAVFESSWKVEAAEVLAPGRGLDLGAYRLTLQQVGQALGPNYDAERGLVQVTKDGSPVCYARPERRTYAADGQTTSEVAICAGPLNDIYVVLSEARPLPDGTAGRLVRAYWNPWARLIFLGPLIMALGGALSLSDRRLRFAVGRRAPRPATARPSLEPAE